MEINTSQWIDVDAEFSVQEVYDAMDESEIEEMIDLLQKNGYLNPIFKNEEYKKSYSDTEWERMLQGLVHRNTRLLITDEEYEQVKAIYTRIGK